MLPKRCFVLLNGKYIEISTEDFLNHAETYGNRKFIPLHGMLMEVSEQDYQAFYREQERIYYLKKQDRKFGLVSFQALDTEDFKGEAAIEDYEQGPAYIEERIIKRELMREIQQCLSQLTQEELTLIWRYFSGTTQKELAREYGVTRQAIGHRIARILKKLKQLVNK